MHSLSHTRVFRLCVFLGAVDFKQGKDIVRVTKIPLVAVWEPREGTRLEPWAGALGCNGVWLAEESRAWDKVEVG